MSVLELSRWQFGITTVYHFIFVPLTIGLSLVVACMQTAWLIKQDPVYLRMTKFFGKIFLINFAVGVVTGIVQEFQRLRCAAGDGGAAGVLHGVDLHRPVDLRLEQAVTPGAPGHDLAGRHWPIPGPAANGRNRLFRPRFPTFQSPHA